MDDLQKGMRVRTFFDIEASALIEQYKIIETLLPSTGTAGSAHRGEEGRHIESILRSFLNKHLPKSLRAVSGFIICPSTKTGTSNTDRVTNFNDRHSSQLDIIIYDFDSYPVYEQFEEFCIVPPEGVIAIISVKKRLYKDQIKKELEDLQAAIRICHDAKRRSPVTAIFSFSSDPTLSNNLDDKVFQCIKDFYNQSSFDEIINEICILDKTVLFKVRSSDSPPNKARFVGVDCIGKPHIPVQRILNSILSVYYDNTRGSNKERPGFVSFEKAIFKKSPDLGLVDYTKLR